MPEDVRDRTHLDHADVAGLNFIRSACPYVFRRHYRAGLRSHIMEILDPEAVEREKKGLLLNGLRWYPRARPNKVLRIFRTRFRSLEQVEEELKRVKVIQRYLLPDAIADSQEFIVTYTVEGREELLLCGLQEYVRGEILEPWSPLGAAHLELILNRMGPEAASVWTNGGWVHQVRHKAQAFVRRIKKMILEANVVPDLAGVGNLILTAHGDIKLVDINNISKVSFHPFIYVDDRGYPVCDKSIQALALLEKKLMTRPLEGKDFIYKTFLAPQRMKEVEDMERAFHLAPQNTPSYPGHPFS